MFFQIYGETAGWQLLGWLLVFAGLVIMNEIARRSKWGGIACFLVLPAVLSVYFIAIYIGAASGAEWALNNDTYVHMNSWFHYAKLYAATAGCIGFMILKYHWGKLGKADWFKAFPFVIVAINILIAVASDFESAIRAGSLAGGWWMSSEGVWLYGGWWNVLNGLAGLFNIVCMTGWAQIHGRDELEITEKAKLDGWYVEHMSFWLDVKCFFGTIRAVADHDGVVEGGTGTLHEEGK